MGVFGDSLTHSHALVDLKIILPLKEIYHENSYQGNNEIV
jgi:hypothetical protein